MIGGFDSDGILVTGGEPKTMLWTKEDFRQYYARIKGAEPKSMKVPDSNGMGPLYDFEAEVQRYLEDHGMDYIYLKHIFISRSFIL